MFRIPAIVFMIVCLHDVSANTMDDVKTLMADLMVNYSVEVRPVKDQGMPVNVDIRMGILSINDFNEVTGVISVVAVIILSWKDESLVWNPRNYNNTKLLTFSQIKIWAPNLYLLNPASQFKPIRNKHFKVTVLANGTVYWSPGGILKYTCTPDVSKFPFDVQTCTMSITAYGYSAAQVALTTNVPKIDFSFFSNNTAWDIVSAQTVVNNQAADIASFSITMRRRPLNFMSSVVIPIIMLALVNPFVFILPFNSGERTSYSITVLLAFTVYMTVVSDRMPASSDPMSKLSYYLLLLLGLSVLIVTVNIFQIRTYNKDENKEPVPKWMEKFVINCLKFCQKGKVGSKLKPQQDVKQSVIKNETIKSKNIIRLDSMDEADFASVQAHPNEDDGLQTVSLQQKNVTWHTIAKYTDKVYFIVFLVFMGVASFEYFIGVIT